MFLPDEVKKVISMLEASGFEAYTVGGCVRDSLLGKNPGDYDVATSAKPFEMKEVFKNEHVIETGIKHGTLTVLIFSAFTRTSSDTVISFVSFCSTASNRSRVFRFMSVQQGQGAGK